MEPEVKFIEQCRNFLLNEWSNIESFVFNDEYDSKLFTTIDIIQDSSTKTYHYVFPTQLLAKCVNPDVDCTTLQANFSEKSFDARSVCHDVIVPFEKNNYNVLGGSPEPYVNNPLRCAAVSKVFRQRQKNKVHWDLMADFLEQIENSDDPALTLYCFKYVLYSIYKKLADVSVIYATPNRISLYNTIDIINEFISERSGGDRLETVASALFMTIGEHFNLYDDVRRSKINASDQSTKQVADIECFKEGSLLLGVEVKDQELSLTHFESTIDKARASKLSEILFIAQKGRVFDHTAEIDLRIIHEFNSGQNIYTPKFVDFATGILILLGESGRIDFIRRIGPELDRVFSHINNRRRWSELLKSI